MIEGERDVDRNNYFGDRGSATIFISFDALVTWIAKHVKNTEDLWAYMDDSFGINKISDTQWYPCYNRFLPSNQTKLLLLWDRLGVPHEEHKQLQGETLTVIGIEVDAPNLTLTLLRK